MSFFSNLWADLVEKRLWPVVIVLLAALVGVPMALGRGADAVVAPIPVGSTGATGAGPGGVTVTLDAGTALRADRLGRVHDPFDQPGAKAAATPGSAPTGGVAGVAGAEIPSAAGGGSSSPASPATPATPSSPAPSSGSGTPATPTDPAPAVPKPAAPKDTPPADPYLVTLRIGRTADDTPKAKDVKRLTPLPSSSDPFLVYLGVLTNKRTAVFMLSADVTATGDGTCRPRPSSCETVELHKGETERLAVTRDDGTVATYRLDLVRIVQASSAGAPEAVAARHRRQKAVTSVTKRDPSDAEGSDAYSYDGTTGLLQRLGSVSAFGGHLPAPGGGLALRGVPAGEAGPAAGLAAYPVYTPGG